MEGMSTSSVNSGFSDIHVSTTGGSGGTTVTVTSLAALTSAVADSSKKVVVVSGTITGNTVVKVGSNTSVVGKSGAGMSRAIMSTTHG